MFPAGAWLAGQSQMSPAHAMSLLSKLRAQNCLLRLKVSLVKAISDFRDSHEDSAQWVVDYNSIVIIYMIVEEMCI